MPYQYDKKLKAFVDFAVDLADLSTCKRRQVGCIIIPRDMTQVLSIGYNGQASGVPHEMCSATEGNCGCIHAEMNALIKLSTHLEDLILISTLSPCKLCAGLIINTKRIGSVLYLAEYRDTSPLELFDLAEIRHACI